jgi:hypothetical protein
MTIYDLIEEVKHSRNKVIPTEYILKRLREVERHECEHCKQIPVYDMATLTDGYKRVKGGS